MFVSEQWKLITFCFYFLIFVFLAINFTIHENKKKIPGQSQDSTLLVANYVDKISSKLISVSQNKFTSLASFKKKEKKSWSGIFFFYAMCA